MSLTHEELKRRSREDNPKGPRILWHYTTWDSFLNILRTDELWASDYRFMNDRTELLHALEFCQVRIDDLKGTSGLHDFFLRVFRGIHELPGACVLSVSRQVDSLEQWRGYTSNSVGVALAFDAQSLSEVCK